MFMLKNGALRRFTSVVRLRLWAATYFQSEGRRMNPPAPSGMPSGN